MSGTAKQPGVVVIGRNEGDRLRRCFESLGDVTASAVYVDSGSTDGSIELARSRGAQVVELDLERPFTAARARNAGLDALLAGDRTPEFVQFVDGDCELETGWLERAVAELQSEPTLAVVFGRRRERAPDASRFNRLCDLEWDVPIGDVLSCGGDALMRVAALQEVDGYRDDLIAGEEPDLCLRLRARGFGVRRIDAPMTVHDAAMTRTSQWWRRAMRAGYVEAEGLADHGRGYPRRRSALSTVVWSLLAPLTMVAAVLVGALLQQPWLCILPPALLLAAYLRLWWRIVRSSKRWQPAHRRLYATYCVLAKWPMFQGMLVFWWRRLWRRDSRLIEYKRGEA